MNEPAAAALERLAEALRAERSVITALVGDPPYPPPALGALAATGPRAAAAPGEYAVVVESVREGYLLHYGGGRVVTGADPDLALLGGDYLYALGLERLAALGDLAAVTLLSDLITLAATVHASAGAARSEARVAAEADGLWLATAAAVGAGESAAHSAAIGALRAGSPDAAGLLWAAATATAAEAGAGGELDRAAYALDFRQEARS